jgi:hypothetical protein
MDQSNQESARETINVREAGFFLNSENLEEIRPWYMETRSEQVDNDGNDSSYTQE